MSGSGGKIVGAILGFMVGGPLGAGVGAALGHVIDSNSSTSNKSLEYTSTQDQNIVVKNTWIEYKAYQDGETGFKIHLEFEVHGYQHQDILCFCYFTDDTGRPLSGQRKEYQDPNGRVISGERFTNPYSSAAYDDFVIFVPYNAFYWGKANQLNPVGHVVFMDEETVLVTMKNAFTINLQSSGPLPPPFNSGNESPKWGRKSKTESNWQPKRESKTEANWHQEKKQEAYYNPEKDKYMKMFNIPQRATPKEIRDILNAEYNKCRARVNSPDINIAQEANRKLVELGKARAVLLD